MTGARGGAVHVHSWPLHSSTARAQGCCAPPLPLLSAAAASASPVNCTRSSMRSPARSRAALLREELAHCHEAPPHAARGTTTARARATAATSAVRSRRWASAIDVFRNSSKPAQQAARSCATRSRGRVARARRSSPTAGRSPPVVRGERVLRRGGGGGRRRHSDGQRHVARGPARLLAERLPLGAVPRPRRSPRRRRRRRRARPTRCAPSCCPGC